MGASCNRYSGKAMEGTEGTLWSNARRWQQLQLQASQGGAAHEAKVGASNVHWWCLHRHWGSGRVPCLLPDELSSTFHFLWDKPSMSICCCPCLHTSLLLAWSKFLWQEGPVVGTKGWFLNFCQHLNFLQFLSYHADSVEVGERYISFCSQRS